MGAVMTSLIVSDICGLTASLLTEVCSGVAVEPPLQQLRGEELLEAYTNRDDGTLAHIDIAVDGFWGMRRERAYFDIHMFNPYALSNQHFFFHPPTGFTREGRNENTYSVSVILNTDLSLLLFLFIWWNGQRDYHLL